MSETLPIIEKISATVDVIYVVDEHGEWYEDTHEEIGDISIDHFENLTIGDRYGVPIAKYRAGRWIKYTINDYTIPGDHVEVERT